jgi:hypothetical protein
MPLDEKTIRFAEKQILASIDRLRSDTKQRLHKLIAVSEKIRDAEPKARYLNRVLRTVRQTEHVIEVLQRRLARLKYPLPRSRKVKTPATDK